MRKRTGTRKYLDTSKSLQSTTEIKNLSKIRLIWLRYWILVFGFLISIPWLVGLVPRIPGLFDAWMVGTYQESRFSTMSFFQVVIVVSILLSEVLPLIAMIVIGFQIVSFYETNEEESLFFIGHLMWVKSASPIIVGALLLFFSPSNGTWNWGNFSFWQLLTHPEMGFWLYSPILAVITFLIKARQKKLPNEAPDK